MVVDVIEDLEGPKMVGVVGRIESAFGAWSARLLLISALVLGGAAGASASERAASTAVQGFAREIVALANSGQSKSQKRARVQSILSRRAEIDKIVQIAAGRPWRSMSAGQRASFKSAMLPYMAMRFVSFFDQVRGTTTVVKDTKTFTGRTTRVRVRTVSRGNGTPKKITWWVANKGGRQVIQDAVIGDSLRVAFALRGEVQGYFSSAGGNVEKVNAQLRAATRKG